jgi:hypothetical protein
VALAAANLFAMALPIPLDAPVMIMIIVFNYKSSIWNLQSGIYNKQI